MRAVHLKNLLLPVALLLMLVAPAAHAQSGSVDVELEKFGLESSYRPGEMTGIRLELTSTLAEAMQVWVQVELPNADGDVGEYGRHVALTPGQQRSIWLYVPLPSDFNARSVLVVKVFEVEDGQRRRQLGGARLNPGTSGANGVEQTMSVIGVVGEGQRTLRLSDYTNPGTMQGRPPFAHEDTRINFGIRPEDLPDRWEGLKVLEALVWSTFTPRDLTEDQARALRRYIQRGGHLVVVLPATGNPWDLGKPGQNPLEDLLPSQEPRKDLGVPLAKLLPALSKFDRLRDDIPQTVHVFRDITTEYDRVDPPYRPLIALPDGRVISIQRTYGFGRITLLGVDVSSLQLTSLPGAVQADVLWNRILGRRVDTPTGQELSEIKKAERLVGTSQENSLGGGSLFSQLIAMSKQASFGLLTALAVIIMYWFVAGPGGFWILKMNGMHKHAWVAFAASAGVFTAVAWGIVSLIKPSRYTVKHVTFLDMLARPGGDRPEDPQLTRATSWFSLNMPGYRPTAVFLDSDPDQRDLLTSWSPAELPSQPFPNPDRYRIDVGTSPADYQHFMVRNDGLPDYKRPSRSTVTQLYANWMGGLKDDWEGRMIRVTTDNKARTVKDVLGNEQLVGEVEHDLPGDLENVLIIWVKSNRLPHRRYAASGGAADPWVPYYSSGQMLNTGGMWILPLWNAGARLSLSEMVEADKGRSQPLDFEIAERFYKPYAKSTLTGALPGSAGAIGPENRKNYLWMLSLFNQLKPPMYLNDKAGNKSNEGVTFYRLVGRELDLSPWLTGPCLIVIGELKGATNPVPLRINGEPPEDDENSMTIVRWILPLGLDEKIAFPDAFPRTDDEI